MAQDSPFYNTNDDLDIEGFPLEEVQPEFVSMGELDDGSEVYDFAGAEDNLLDEEEEAPLPFDRNLCDELDEDVKSKLATDLIEKIESDLEARKGWDTAVTQGMKYLGIKVEEHRSIPFEGACSAFDSTLSKALFRYWATARAELYPSEGPVKTQVLGDKTTEALDQSERIKVWMNHYLTRMDRDYIPNSIRMLLYVGLAGSAYKKVYQSPITFRPISRFIDPQDFIPDPEATSIFSASRLTHRMHKTKKELMMLMMNGFYAEEKLDDPDDSDEDDEITLTAKESQGVDTSSLDEKKMYKLYETHADVDLTGFEHTDEEGNTTGMPLPYIVTISEPSKKVIGVRRNWEEDDSTFERIQSFIKYDFLPGFGFYGIGYAQLLGSNAIALTAVLRQLIDAGKLKNFPGGLRIKGLRLESNDKTIGPAEFKEIETGGLPIKDAVMLMPYNEPSIVLKELRENLKADTEELAAVSDLKIADMNNETPVGTTMAMLEVQTKVQSSVMRSLHMSLSYELELIYNLFVKGIEKDPGLLNVPGMSHFVRKEDFTDAIRIVPVSDPNLTTNTQRMMHAEAILRLAQSNPELHDLRNAYRRMYTAMNVEDIDSLLPAPEEAAPLDPISENKNSMEGKPLKAEMWQDHQAHVTVHEGFSIENPDIEALKAHIYEHRAMLYLIEMQNQLGYPLPPLEQLRDPQIQNAIAMQAAQVIMQQQAMDDEQNPQPLDPSVVMMEDINQRDRAALLKNEESKDRTELDAFKAQLKFETEKKKIEADLEMTEEDNETELEIAEMKLQEARIRNNAKINKGD